MGPELLERFVDQFEVDGERFCCANVEEAACCFRKYFDLPTPMALAHASEFIYRFYDVKCFLQPSLEITKRIKALWVSWEGENYMLVDPDRPIPSQIKSMLHEFAEQLLAISHSRHPEVKIRKTRAREKWANQFAAYIVMPPDIFRKTFAEYQLDLEMVKKHFSDTLAGVSRHVRDLVLSDHPFYFCRLDLVYRPERVCEAMIPVIESTGGLCMIVRDVVRTGRIITRGINGSLPLYNLPLSDHYRVLNPVMNQFLEKSQPVLFSVLEGNSSDAGSLGDLFGDQTLCTLFIPYGKRRKGLFMIAVHPDDQHLLDNLVKRISPEERGELPWLFSRASYTRKRMTAPSIQNSLPGVNGWNPNEAIVDEQCYAWPKFDDADKSMAFRFDA